jgi:hypothetical protein
MPREEITPERQSEIGKLMGKVETPAPKLSLRQYLERDGLFPINSRRGVEFYTGEHYGDR